MGLFVCWGGWGKRGVGLVVLVVVEGGRGLVTLARTHADMPATSKQEPCMKTAAMRRAFWYVTVQTGQSPTTNNHV